MKTRISFVLFDLCLHNSFIGSTGSPLYGTSGGTTVGANNSSHNKFKGFNLFNMQIIVRFTCFLFITFTSFTVIFTHKVTESGDILLGGLFPIHQKGSNSSRCGPINKDRGIQRLEAMLFAIDKINADPNLLGKIKLGAIILDTCSSDSYALNQSLEFIRASINTVESSAFECRDGSTPRPKYGSKHISGVVGGSYSEVSLQVANLLRLFKMPQVSYASTGTSLSDKTRYDFFARTVPPDTYQALALVDLVQSFNWSYVSLVTSEGQYGDSGMNAFAREAKKRNICIAMNEKVPMNADQHYFNQILTNLKMKSNAKGVVLFLRAEDNRGLLEAAKAANQTNSFSFIASDGWGTQAKLVEGVEEEAEGTITVELQSREIEEFDYYMGNMSAYHNRNPWFQEYWEDTFSCRLPPYTHNVDTDNNNSLPICSPNLRIDRSMGYRQESKVQFVVDAVYAFAHALHNAWLDLCSGTENYCPALKELDGESFYKNYLLNVSFIDLAGSEMKFDRNGDGLGRYNIFNYQQIPDTNQYQYVLVGRWADEGLELNKDELKFNEGVPEVPTSICSNPCSLGEIKIVQQGDTCCWICAKCDPWAYVYNESHCEDCGAGRWPNKDKQSCYDLPIQYMKWDSLFAIIPVVIACLGISLTLFVIFTFIKYSDTPIVKASGRELSFILLGGIMFCYLNTFILLWKPMTIICALQRFGVGFGFCIIYGALLTKTNRISRIFDSARKSARRPSFISPKSQVLITMILVSIQVIGNLVWFVLEPPGTRQFHPDGKRSEVILKCRVRDSSFLLSLVYNMFLITTCTLYAVKTRKIPENFNESKFIGFTMYTTCIIWLAFVPIYFGTGNSFEIQITTLSVSISLSAYVALFCLFSPKIYIIIFHPDKNVRKLTMNSATYKKAPTTSTTCPTTSANHGLWYYHCYRARQADSGHTGQGYGRQSYPSSPASHTTTPSHTTTDCSRRRCQRR
ncbi:metabotropic glutamate receptor-like isoform X2 [Oppia nitens]|uniref:metabotropic glutamate receptor-like isoform X2 n=1 Tax=Oppia nitens TaxID=1686743 RepID=UPI0023DCDE7A|nr:metabotropic glutamate receptor-like isoform X2 [Oppia nitens]